MSTIKEVFDRAFSDVVFDKTLCSNIVKFSIGFMSKNVEHAEFFGSPLLGVNLIRFTESDVRDYFEETLGIDEIALRDDFRENASSVNFDFNVMSEPFNYMGVYLAYRIERARSVPTLIREQARQHALMITFYRFLSGLFYRRFSYKADYEVSMATYSNLTQRFDVKRYGSWRKLLEERAKETLYKTSNFKLAFKDFEPDKAVIAVVIGMQGGIRSIVNNYYSAYMETLERRERVSTQSAVLSNVSGETFLRDSTKGAPAYQAYLQSVLSSGTSFIKPELVTIASRMCKHASEEAILNVLNFIVSNIDSKKHSYIQELVYDTVNYVFQFSAENASTIRHNDFISLLERLKGNLTSSRITDPTVLRMRKCAEKLVKNTTKIKTGFVLTGIRTAVIMYIALRTVTKDHYSN